MRTLTSLLAVAVVLGACGAPHLQTVRQAKSDLIGADAALLERCIGAPQTVTPTTDGEIWRYSSAQQRDGTGRTRPTAAAPDRACVFDVTLVDGRVVRVTSDNRAGWGFGSIKACARLVERCVAPDERWREG